MRKEVIIALAGLIGILFFSGVVSAIEKAPKIEIEPEIYVCEGQSLSYIFLGNYSGENNLSANIYPKNPFFIRALENEKNKFEIFSARLNKSYVGRTYEENVSVFDSSLLDWKNVKIHVIEINNPVKIDDLSVETVDLERGGIFLKNILAEDIEDGTQVDGKLMFNLSFISGRKIFGIDNRGKISFVSNKSYVGKYIIEVCAQDLGIKNISNRINLCGQEGKISKVCKNFQLTITEKNTGPTIKSKFPAHGEIIVKENESRNLNFNVIGFDPDGTNPDIYWYADEKLIEKNKNNFSYVLDCKNKSSNAVIKAEVRDGLEKDNVSWIVRGVNLTCAAENESCEIKKGCDEWGLCQKALQSAEIGVLAQDDYDNVKKSCGKLGWADINCGYQTRSCGEISECKNDINIGLEIRECFFAYDPGCNDRLLNCHNGGCEELIDCGGPCAACPSCSDRRKNGNELGIDCGGLCLNECKIYYHIYDRDGIKYIIAMFIFILIGGIILILRNILYIKKKVKEIPMEKLR